MKQIYAIDGGKGGVGKSIVSGALIDTILQQQRGKVFLVDSDPSNPDVAKSYSGAPWLAGCAFLNMDNNEGFLDLIDCIQTSGTDYVVINCPARAEGWLKYGALLIENLTEFDANFVTLWVLGRQRDSVESLKVYHDALPTVIIHPTMNTYWGQPSDFQIWNGSKVRQSILNSGGKEILFPSVADRVTDQMRTARRRWDDEENIPLSLKLESRRFRAAAYSALESIL